MIDTDKILEIINSLAPLLYVIVPAIWAVIWNIKKKIDEKRKEEQQKHKDKLEKEYDKWEHEESKAVIRKIKEYCNFYKDRGCADLVHFMQLENGTVATSRLQNMFMTCLAEDDRFGNLPKQIDRLQRIPYSECAEWVAQITADENIKKQILKVPTMESVKYNESFVEGRKRSIHSSIAAPIYDSYELLLGVVVFYYCGENYNGKEEEETEAMTLFRNSVESVFYTYHMNQVNKKKELGLED